MRPRVSTRSTTTSSGSPTITRGRRDSRSVETNFVQLDVTPLSKEEAIRVLAEHGVALSATIHPSVLRAVTHLDVEDEDIDGALEAIPRALGARVRA